MSDLVTQFEIKPSYQAGFNFTWEYALGIPPADIPTIFITVQHSQNGIDGWEDFSPTLTNATMWSAGTAVSKFHAGHDEFYRLKTEFKGDVGHTESVGVYSTLSKREMLLGKNLIRQEQLAAKTTGGSDFSIYQQRIGADIEGTVCSKCHDPVSGVRYTDSCKYCTDGREGASSGDIWLGPYAHRARVMNADTIKVTTDPDGGMRDVRKFTVRLDASPVLTRDDILIERSTDRRYIVEGVKVVAELSRVPILQDAVVVLLEYEHPAYKLGVDNAC